MTRPRLALYGNFGRQNIGNECTLRAVLVHLRSQLPEMTAFCVCSNPAIVEDEHGVAAVAISRERGARAQDAAITRSGVVGKLSRLAHRFLFGVPRQVAEALRAYRILKDVDALILVGTGMLEDEDGNTAWPLVTCRWTLAARLRGCCVMILGIGAGPFQTSATRILSTAILRAAHYVSYRDAESRDCVTAAGLDTSRHVIVPDLAFSLPIRLPSRDSANPRASSAIALGVIDRTKFAGDFQYREYLQTLSRFAESLIQQGHTVHVIHGDGLYDNESLATIASSLAAMGLSVHNEKVRIPSIRSMDDLLAVLEGVDLVVASRYHNVILALMLGRPVLALSYHWKFASVMAWFQLSNYVRPVRESELNWLLDRSSELLAKREELIPEILKVADACRTSVMQQYSVVRQKARARRSRGQC